MSDHKYIYLEPLFEPRCDGEQDWYDTDGRQWCQDDVWSEHDYHGVKATRYIRSDLYKEQEIDLTKEIQAREFWELKATELANDIAGALGFWVGEHSSSNCPVQNAIDGISEMASQVEEWKRIYTKFHTLDPMS